MLRQSMYPLHGAYERASCYKDLFSFDRALELPIEPIEQRDIRML